MKVKQLYTDSSPKLFLSEFFWSFLVPQDFEAIRHTADQMCIFNGKDVRLEVNCHHKTRLDPGWLKESFGEWHFQFFLPVEKAFWSIAYYKGVNENSEIY